jgi:1-deoxyxylulose-5-phosphate synthase
VIERAAEVAAQRGVSTAQIALSWLPHKPGVTAPIVGATRLEEPYVPHPASGIDL